MLIANLRRTQTLSARGCQNESKVNPDISYPPIVRLPASRHIVGGHNAHEVNRVRGRKGVARNRNDSNIKTVPDLVMCAEDTERVAAQSEPPSGFR
jgi:hypothetical protein